MIYTKFKSLHQVVHMAGHVQRKEVLRVNVSQVSMVQQPEVRKRNYKTNSVSINSKRSFHIDFFLETEADIPFHSYSQRREHVFAFPFPLSLVHKVVKQTSLIVEVQFRLF